MLRPPHRNRFFALLLVSLALTGAVCRAQDDDDLRYLKHKKALGAVAASFGATPTISSNTACSAGTTCAVTLTGNMNAGDALLIYTATTAAVTISSVSCGTYVSGGALSGRGEAGVLYNNIGYVLSATAVSSGNPCTITYSATSSTTNTAWIYDYTVSGGTPALDAVNSYLQVSGLSSPYTAQGLTLTGTKDIILAATSSSNNVTAVSGSWTHKTFATTTGLADQVNVTSVSAPAWTSSGVGQASWSVLALGFAPTTAQPYGIFDSSAGASGGTPTVANLTSSTFGLASGGPAAATDDNWSWVISNNATPGVTYLTAAHHPLYSAAPRLYAGGAAYTDSGTVGLQYNTTTGGGSNYLQLETPGFNYGVQASFTGASVVCHDFFTDLPVTTFTHFDYQTNGGSGGDFATLQIGASGTNLFVTLEGGSFSSGNLNLPFVAQTATFTNGSANIGVTNAFVAGQPVQFLTSGSLPTGFSTGTLYYVISTGLSGSNIQLSATPGGTAITAGSAGSGTQTLSVWYKACVNYNPGFSATSTFTNSSAVISATQSFVVNQAIQFTTSGTLPTNFAANTTYFVISTGLSTSQFEVSATVGGSAITAGSAGSGTQTVHNTGQAEIWEETGPIISGTQPTLTVVGSIYDTQAGTHNIGAIDWGNASAGSPTTGHIIYADKFTVCFASGLTCPFPAQQ